MILNITNSNYNRNTFILQQNLKKENEKGNASAFDMTDILIDYSSLQAFSL